jgi:hypothetical protein
MHDFNNLLLLMGGHLDKLEHRLAGAGLSAGVLDDLRSALELAGQLPRQLLRLARGEQTPRQRLDLNTLAASLEGLLRPRLGRVRMEVEPAATPAWVEADPAQLGQVLLNLASNALDAMPAGGTLGLCLEVVEQPGPGGVLGRWVCVQVRDTGRGMSVEEQRRVLEPLFTTPAGGPGMGLVVVRDVVARHGGWLECDSTPGVGTTFRVYLPAAGRAAPGDRRAGVLIVERDPDIRHLSAMILGHGHFAPLACANLAEAKDLARQQPERIRLVVADGESCTGRGLAELGELLDRLPGANLLFTSTGRVVQWPARHDARVRGIVPKPFGVEPFLRAVEVALA